MFPHLLAFLSRNISALFFWNRPALLVSHSAALFLGLVLANLQSESVLFFFCKPTIFRIINLLKDTNMWKHLCSFFQTYIQNHHYIHYIYYTNMWKHFHRQSESSLLKGHKYMKTFAQIIVIGLPHCPQQCRSWLGPLGTHFLEPANVIEWMDEIENVRNWNVELYNELNELNLPRVSSINI